MFSEQSQMKSFSLQFLSALGAGVVAALFLHTNPSVLPVQLRTASGSGAKWTQVSNRHAEGELVAASATASAQAASPAAANQPALPPVPAGTPTLLLNEPVDILNHADATWTCLPRGTSVRLLAERGPLLQVRHGNDIVTVPRSTVVAGVSRMN